MKREVGLSSHSLSHFFPVPNNYPYGFCGRNSMKAEEEEEEEAAIVEPHSSACRTKHGLRIKANSFILVFADHALMFCSLLIEKYEKGRGIALPGISFRESFRLV